MRIALLFVCCVMAFTACTKERVRISGHIANAGNTMLYLDEVDVYNTIPADSLKLKANGKFSFSYDTKYPCFLQLRLSPEKIIVLFPRPGEKIKIDADAVNLLPSIAVTGSHDTEQITKLINLLNDTRTRLDSVSVLFEKASDDSVKNRLNREYQDILEQHRKASMAYILTNYNSLSGVYALYQQYKPGYYVFFKTTDLQFFKIMSDSLSKYHPRSRHVAALKNYTNKQLSDYKSLLLQKNANIMEGLPPVKLPDFAGDTMTLSSLKGKYVLLSFWVSGDQNCLNQNLQLKKVYEIYKNRGFEVFQVSLDNSPESWRRAVRYDELPWISVIASGPSSIAGNYNVKEVPANYLIGKDNISILGKNLTPAQLQDKLQELYN